MSMVLVTGGTGFLGGALVRQLLDAGREVSVLARTRDEALESAGAKFVTGSILDQKVVRRAVKGVDEIYHCAGLVSRDREHARLLYQVHVEGSAVLLNAAAAAGVRRVVVTSTSGTIAVSRDDDPPPDETAHDPITLIGDWPYYTSKLYQEHHVFRLGRDLGLEVVCVNPSLLLGPGDERMSSTGDVLKFLNRDVPTVPAGGLSFVDARDVAVAMRSAMEKGRPGERYLLGAANMTFSAFFDKLAAISGVKAPRLKLPPSATRLGAKVLHLAGKAFGFEPPVDPVTAEMSEVFWYLDDGKARRELDWAPRDPYETLADTVVDLKERGLWEPKAA